MQAIIDQDNPPRGHELGGIEPEITSPAQLETAVETLAHITSRRDTVLAAYTQAVALLADTRDQKLKIEVDGQSVTFDDREDALRQAIADYVTAHRDQVFPTDTQTRKFARGTVCLRKSPPRIDVTAGHTKPEICKRLIKRHNLLAKLIDYAKRTKIAPFLRLKAELDVAGLSAAVKAGKLKPAQLTKEGLRYVTDEETVDVKIHPPTGRTHTDQPAASP